MDATLPLGRRLAEDEKRKAMERETKWFYEAKAAGIFRPGALDEWYGMSESEEEFFKSYEKQMQS